MRPSNFFMQLFYGIYATNGVGPTLKLKKSDLKFEFMEIDKISPLSDF